MITLFTDASFDHRYPEAAAFAAWAKAGDGLTTFRYSRNFKEPNHPRNSSEAELMGIMVGLILVRKHWPLENHVHICSDNTGALSSIARRRFLTQRASHPHLNPIIDHYLNFLNANPTRITMKHVKAHTIKRSVDGAVIGDPSPRHHVNDWCDREAYRLMDAKRSLLQAQEQGKKVWMPKKTKDDGRW